MVFGGSALHINRYCNKMLYMRIWFFLFITTALVTLSNACGDKPPPVNALSASTQPSPVNTIVLPKDGNYDSKGKVTKIDKQLGSIELLHEEIPGLMPAMQMEIFVGDKAILEAQSGRQ